MSSTIFDDVFRTMVEKMTQLVIPLINEAFGTDYPLDVKYEQLRNEHQLPDGEIITDSCLMIGKCYYHIECQSTDDKTMAIRMVEYDFHIALEHAFRKGYAYTMEFPKSCVLYIRDEKVSKTLDVNILFQDGSEHIYSIPTLKVADYDEKEIMEKRLLFFLPYYILRFEKSFSEMEKNPEMIANLRKKYEQIELDLQAVLKNDSDGLSSDIMGLSGEIADYVLQKYQGIRKELDFMGGKVLKLESEKNFERGEKLQAVETAKVMFSYNEPIDKICKYTKLTEAEVLEIEKELKAPLYG